MKLSVIIPVYNERDTVEELLRRVLAVKMEKEIIVVDDGSQDGTRGILERLSRLGAPIQVIYHEDNQGKGAAIRTGLEHITGSVVIVQDADLEYNPQEYKTLLKPILDGTTSVVYGSRNLQQNPHSSFWFYWGGRILSWIVTLLYAQHITDEATCYKMFRASILKNLDLQCTGFEFCPEVTAKVLRSGLRIVEVPISYSPRAISQGKKIRGSDGLMAIWTLLKYRFWSPRQSAES